MNLLNLSACLLAEHHGMAMCDNTLPYLPIEGLLWYSHEGLGGNTRSAFLSQNEITFIASPEHFVN